MRRRPPISTRTDTLVPFRTVFRAVLQVDADGQDVADLGGALVLEELPRARPPQRIGVARRNLGSRHRQADRAIVALLGGVVDLAHFRRLARSEEHTSELQSLMRISYAVFCLKKKTP